MVSEEATRKMIRQFTTAGWTEISHDGRHTKFGCQCGAHTFPLPTTHRMVSPGVVRNARKAIQECKGK